MSYRAADYCCIFDGQSLNIYPSQGHVNSYPKQFMAGRTNAVEGIPGLSGLSWQQLDNDLPSRVGPYMKLSSTTFYLMVGGTTQVQLGQPAATIYTTEGDIAAIARSLGATYIIGSTTTPSTAFSQASNDILDELNDLKRADASNYYDAMVDLAADPRLDDPTDTTYYVDGTHPTTAGLAAIAELMGAAVDAILQA